MIDDPKDKSDLTESLRGLLKIATILRDRRIEKGALTLASPEIKFKFERETKDRRNGEENKRKFVQIQTKMERTKKIRMDQAICKENFVIYDVSSKDIILAS